MANPTELANKALILAGASARIGSLTDDTQVTAQTIRILWDQARDAMLEEKLWKFAKRRWVLPAATQGPLHGPKYRYVRPNDCVKVWRLEPSRHGERAPFDREETAIVADFSPPLYIIGTAKIVDATLWDGMFAEAFAYKLAAQLADGKTGSAGRAANLLEEYKKQIRDARWGGSIEVQHGEREAGTFAQARFSP